MDGDLIHAGSVHGGKGLQPGGSFVVRRNATSGAALWVFRTDSLATDLDADEETVSVTYRDCEIVALDLQDGRVHWRDRLTAGAVPVVLTALTVTGPGHLLIGTGDGRVLECSAVRRVGGEGVVR